ncbi:BMP family ABC transporter substrate-binding protein, partial [Enterococcus lactis]|nr:BMP family ABC transporter substrate-binding protein [Enterococcus lactis]
GEHTVCGLIEDGVGLTEGQLSDEAKKAVVVAKDKIISGVVNVPETPEEY